MKIFELIEVLQSKYSEDIIVRRNNTLLLGPGKIPKAKHLIFPGLSPEIIDEFLVSEYKYRFPTQYSEFLQHYNGCNLFMFKIRKGKLEFASTNLIVFGLPRTQPFGRPLDMEEPYDVRIEDLGRHANLPNTWIKCGCYKKAFEFGDPADIFIDTETEHVFACMRNNDQVIEHWLSLDECLCDLFVKVSNYGDELKVK